MTTYNNNLGIAEIGTGQEAGVWGNTTNYNLATLLGEAIAGYADDIRVTSTDRILSSLDGQTCEARQAVLLLTGTPGLNFSVWAPPLTKIFLIRNSTDNIATIRVSASRNTATPISGSQTVAIPAGATAIVYCDGQNAYEGVNSIVGNLAVGGTLTAGGNGTFGGTGNLVIPAGTTAQRGSNTTGAIRFNSTLLTYEGYNGLAWGSLGGGGSGGGGTNQAFFENDKTVTVSYTITSGKNAMSAGPMTIASGFAGDATLTLDGTTGAGYILTVSNTTSGELVLGTVITGTGFPANTTISAFGTGSGGNGTYTVTYAGSAVSLTAPTAIASTVVVTVPSGSNWVVVSGQNPNP